MILHHPNVVVMSLSYLLQITIIWTFSYGFYRWWLSGERMPRTNRIFLLLALSAGPLFPLLPRPDWPGGELSPALLPVRNFLIELETLTVTNTSVAPVDGWGSLPWYYWIWIGGTMLFLGRMIYGWQQIYRLYRSGKTSREDGVTVVRLSAIVSPFSYGPLLFWNESADRFTDEWRSVWNHERAHVLQGHSYDLLINDLLLAVFWWHPLPHLYRNALRLQHEFLADAAAAGTKPRAYARFLLEQKLYGWVPAPGHAFHQSFIKNRINMLTQPKGAGWKLLAVLPLLLLIFWACEKESDLTGASIAETEAKMAADRGQQPETGQFELVDGEKVYLTVDKMPVYGNCAAEKESGDTEELYNCSNLNLLSAVYENVKYPKTASAAGLEGLVVVSFVVPAEGGAVENIEIIKPAQPKDAVAIASEEAAYTDMDNAVIKVVKEMPATWSPGVHEGKPVSVKFNLPVKFRLE